MPLVGPWEKKQEGRGSKIADVVYFDDDVGQNPVATKEAKVGVGVVEVGQVVAMT